MPKVVKFAAETSMAVAKGTLKNATKAQDADWFGSNITPTANPAQHRIQVTMSAAGVVTVYMDDGTTANKVYKMNGGVSLVADCTYVFDILVPSGYSYNIAHGIAAGADVDCEIVEVAQVS